MGSYNWDILVLGDEILDGRIQDANIRTLVQWLQARGQRVRQACCLRDDKTAIVGFLQQALRDGVSVCTTGGLGPTADDCTTEAVAQAVGVETRLYEDQLQILQDKFRLFGIAMPETNRKQACFPAGATVLSNAAGTAPGFVVEAQGGLVLSLPGVPREIEAILPAFDEQFSQLWPRRTQPIERHIRCFGITESRLAKHMQEILPAYPGVSFHDRFAFPEIHMYLKAQDTPVLDAATAFVMQQPWAYSCDGRSLAEQVLDLLRQRSQTLAVAESCTGGLLGSMLVQPAGASDVFAGGILAYSNAVKERMLGVPVPVLESVGAVSSETAEAMALGARDRLQTSWAVSVTGIAGPGGGSEEKPVGTVWIGVAGPGGLVLSRGNHFRWDRLRNRQVSAWTALQILQQTMMDESNTGNEIHE